jgi:menaquinone-dependent protoporphyrinogen oxidase
MKLLIAYVSRTGSSRFCAEFIAKELEQKAEVDVFDLEEKTPSLEGYDAVIVGGPVRLGVYPKALRQFIKNNRAKLSALPCAVYFCCGISRNAEEYSETLIPRKFVASLGVHHFGGELKPQKAKGFDKIFIRHLRSSVKYYDFEDRDASDVSLPELMPENAHLLAEEIKRMAIKQYL